MNETSDPSAPSGGSDATPSGAPGTQQPSGTSTDPGARSHPGAGSAPPPPPHTPSAVERFFARLHQADIRRRTEDKWLGGVASGIAVRLGVDPVIIRLAFVVTAFFGGVGIALYLAAWVILPNARDEIIAERGVRDGDVGSLLMTILAVVLLVAPVVNGPGDGLRGWFWPFWLILVPVGLLVWFLSRRSTAGTTRDAASGVGPYAAQAGQGPPDPTTSPAAQPGPGAEPPYTGAPPPYAGAQPPYPQVSSAGQPPAYEPPPPGLTLPPPGPQPPRPQPPRAGFLGALVVGGLAVTAYGIVTLLHDQLHWDGSAHVVGLAAALTVVGLALVVLGLAGIRSGFTAAIAIFLAVVTWVAAIAPSVDIHGGIGDRNWRPATAVSQTYQLAVGNARLDLRDYPTDPASVETLTVSMGAGDLSVLVPNDLTVEVDAQVDAGTITEDGVDLGNAGDRNSAGVAVHDTYGGGAVDVVVVVDLKAGQIQIEKV